MRARWDAVKLNVRKKNGRVRRPSGIELSGWRGRLSVKSSPPAHVRTHTSHGRLGESSRTPHSHIMFYEWTPTEQPHQPHIYSQNITLSTPNGAEEVTTFSVAPKITEVEAGEVEVKQTNLSDSRSEPENRRNERERQRVRQVNAAFALLRQHLPPSVQADDFSVSEGSCRTTSRKRRSQRTSKVKTLRAAIRYINELMRILQASEETKK